MSKIFFIVNAHFGDSVTFQTSREYKFFSNVEEKFGEYLYEKILDYPAECDYYAFTKW